MLTKVSEVNILMMPNCGTLMYVVFGNGHWLVRSGGLLLTLLLWQRREQTRVHGHAYVRSYTVHING